MSGSIQYLERDQLDIAKWDRCIDTAPNGLVYGYSYYLDRMAQHWDALVMGDYECIMPLTWNKKYGIAYLYQPFLAAQLGIFGKNINAERVTSFLQSIPSRFRYWDIYLNYQNVHKLEAFDLYSRTNFILNLNKPYLEIYNGYRENIQRNIKKSEQAGCVVRKDFDVEEVIDLAIQQMRNYAKESKENTARFRDLYRQLHENKMATTYGIQLGSVLVASCVFFFSHNRAYYILVGNHPDGKTVGASHALIDAFIRDHAGKEFTLDFEGSDIPSLAFFYSSFGAVEENYAAIRLNRLPFYLKWLKK